MSILKSLSTGATGLGAHNQAINTVSDNIANVNTVGFKKQRVIFEDMLGRAVGQGNEPPMSGGGARISAIEQMWTQGALMTTEAPTDLALSGDGFFVVNGPTGGVSGNSYTRAGQFHIDSDGNLANSQGMILQGYGANQDGSISNELSDLTVAGQAISPVSTSEVDLAINLDPESEIIAGGFDPADPANSSNFSTAASVYDSLGTAHATTIYFTKTANNAWEWHAMVDGGELDGGVEGTPTEGANGTLTFNAEGALDEENTVASDWSFVGATANQSIAFDFGTSITTDGGLGTDATTQFAGASTTNAITQDGFSGGTVSAIGIDKDGLITGIFSNGQQRTIGQVAVAKFGSNNGLGRAGNGLWVETDDSGQPLIGSAESGGRGSVIAGALEQSNVDLSQEFVNLISYQRGFQANSKVITTADEMYADLANMKR